MTDIHIVADYIIESFSPEEISLLKLQALLYLTQGYHLALYGTPLFEEDFEARVHGPINFEICERFSNGCGLLTLISEKLPNVSISNDLKKFIDRIIETYGNFTGDQLEHITRHSPPWELARKGLHDYESCKNKIDKLSMKEYFISII